MSSEIKYSIVVPIYNSSKAIAKLVKDVSEIMFSNKLSFEIVLVDDSSKDDSWKVMKTLKETHPFLQLIRLGKNVGQFAATFAGATRAKGDIIITYDDDMQYPPSEIIKLINHFNISEQKWIYGVPIKRKLTLKNKVYSFFIHLLVKLTILKNYVPKKYFYSGFRIFEKPILNHKNINPNNTKYLDTFAIWILDPKYIGFYEVEHQRRKHNKSGQTFKKKFNDGLT
jgi:undecaprenyl-phosphate 4-deoxy-4-formamido-L-arabinose transferase